ncbi:hypothetical protein J2787_001062 [Chryseobacterium rhizosphaerae]|uniref:Uncharacterized protein n=1 Tax=Chryseobacterium rhizosphaerae TaxID=395937 RepID=A0AAE4C2E5_9FLAO|nr:hypothetical protein [Chryseobacterium rhizosphaerae]MDR6525692.1 hypothetical protein [Chryseobacterium rhizosphaerae]
MEEIIAKFNDNFNSQTFRVTYKSRDFQVKILKKEVRREVTEIEILLDGIIQKLVKNNNKWTFGHGQDPEFANDIWRAISLRYKF